MTGLRSARMACGHARRIPRPRKPALFLPVVLGDAMRHRPEYISPTAQYVRPVTPRPAASAPRPRPARSAWLPVVGAVVVFVGLFCLLVYGIATIADEVSAPHDRVGVWVTPTTYGPPAVGRPVVASRG